MHLKKHSAYDNLIDWHDSSSTISVAQAQTLGNLRWNRWENWQSPNTLLSETTWRTEKFQVIGFPYKVGQEVYTQARSANKLHGVQMYWHNNQWQAVRFHSKIIVGFFYNPNDQKIIDHFHSIGIGNG